MRLSVRVIDVEFDIEVGKGLQHARWLGLLAATRYAELSPGPAAFLIPTAVKTVEGRLIQPHQSLKEALADGGDTLVVELAIRGDALSKMVSRDDTVYPSLKPAAIEGTCNASFGNQLDTWREEAYGHESNLIRCCIRWTPSKQQHPSEIPIKIKGTYLIDDKWVGLFPQAEFGGPFDDIPLEGIKRGDATGYHWNAMLLRPPGTALFKFVLPNSDEVVCEALPKIGKTEKEEGIHNIIHFKWDAPITEDPQCVFDKTSTDVSSADDERPTDPRFKEDWGKLKLSWLIEEDEVNVKDVLIEFYEVLIDLFDSYAFLGIPSGDSSVCNTMGVDDFKHLMIQSGRISPNEVIKWCIIKKWLTVINPGLFSPNRPCLQQRLHRHQYLDLLVRVALESNHNHNSDIGLLPDEAVFRFVKNVLLPLMSNYDSDYIRRKAVESDNLVLLQSYRTHLRSLHSLLQQQREDDEMLVPQDSLKSVLTFLSKEGYYGGGNEEVPLSEGSQRVGGARLEPQHVDTMIQAYDEVLATILHKRSYHTDNSGLLFWEFFELFMYLCDSIKDSVPMPEAIPRTLGTLIATMNQMAARGLEQPGQEDALTDPSLGRGEDDEPTEEYEEDQ